MGVSGRGLWTFHLSGSACRESETTLAGLNRPFMRELTEGLSEEPWDALPRMTPQHKMVEVAPKGNHHAVHSGKLRNRTL